MEYKFTFEDGSEAYLAHYGVKGMKWKNRKTPVVEGDYNSRKAAYAKKGLELRKDGSLWDLPKKKNSTSKLSKLESIASKMTAAANGATAKSLKAKVKSRFRSKNVSDETLLRRRRAFENRYTEVDEKGNTRIRKYQ